MKSIATALAEVIVLEPQLFGDQRGFFMETFNARVFAELTGCTQPFVQDNYSRSARGVLRGLHYQVGPHPQDKLVRAVVGEIYDVAVDIRRDSSTYGRWTGVYLNAENRRQLWVPKGFAHGFVVTSEWAEVAYKVTDYYDPSGERSIRWDDPDIGIQWPYNDEPVLSAKDIVGQSFKTAELME